MAPEAAAAPSHSSNPSSLTPVRGDAEIAAPSDSVPAPPAPQVAERPAIKAKRSPYEPTQLEIDEHNASHCPYRSWCRACVAGRGRSDPHFAVDSDDSAIPTIAIDYGYLKDNPDHADDDESSDPKASPIIFSKHSKTKWVGAGVVPSKGTAHPYNVIALSAVYELSGETKVLAKSDQEPAILDLKRKAQTRATQRCGIAFLPEESPVGESQYSGLAEKHCEGIKRSCTHSQIFR